MKSFASTTRDSLTRHDDPRADTRESRLAELAGLAISCGSLTLAGGGVCLTMQTEHAGTGRWIVRLLRHTFDIAPSLRVVRGDRLGGRTTYEIRLEEADGVIRALGISPLHPTVPRQCLKKRKSRDAFVRGMFLGCGTITSPQKGYQMEFSLVSEKMASAFSRLLRTFYQVNAGVSQRRSAYVVYIRDSEGIIAVLSAIGAHGAILDIENVRITKDARNRANRAANCDNGNITKMLDAAQRQLEAVALIEETIGLDALPEALRDIAMERKRNPDVSLEALGAMLEPPVGKSGVYHRLSRIEAIARTLANKDGKGMDQQ